MKAIFLIASAALIVACSPNSEGDIGNWTVSDEHDDFTALDFGTIALRSEGNDAVLFIGCEVHGSERSRVRLQITHEDLVHGNFLGTDHLVKYDEAQPIDLTLNNQQNIINIFGYQTHVASANSGYRSEWIDLMSRIMHSSSMEIRFQVIGPTPVEAEFDTSDSHAAIEWIHEQCGEDLVFNDPVSIK